MVDNLTIIRKVIEEHHNIRTHIKLVGDSMNDLEAFFSLRKVHAGWTQSSKEGMIEKQAKLQQTVSSLSEGLQNHFGFEEKILPPLFGELLMQALIFEHREMMNKLSEAKSMVSETRLEGLDHEELLAKKWDTQQVIGNLPQMIEEHARKEEVILNMIKRALESGPYRVSRVGIDVD